MKNTWQTKELGEICKFIDYRGKTPLKTEAGCPLITAKNIKNGFIKREPKEFVDPNIYDSWMTRGIPKRGDILFTTEAPLANIAQLDTDEKVVFAQRIIILQPQENIIDRAFLKYLLLSSSMREKILSKATGATVQGIKSSLLKKVEIYYPKSLTEQQLIVTTLDKAFSAIDKKKSNAEQNLKNAKELFESYLQNMFENKGESWENAQLSKLCLSDRIITYGIIKLGNEIENGAPCLRTSNVRWLRIDLAGMKKISPKLSEEYSRTILKGGEILVNVRGTLGGVAVVPKTMKGWNVSREVAVVPIDSSKVDPYFISSLIGSVSMQKWLGGVKKGAAYVGINIEDLRQLPISFPEMKEQQAIVQKLDVLSAETKKLEAIYQTKINELEELKKSFLQKAFSGELSKNTDINTNINVHA